MGCISSKQAVLNASPVVERRRQRRRLPLVISRSRRRGRDTETTPNDPVSTSSSKLPHSGVLSFRDDKDDHSFKLDEAVQKGSANVDDNGKAEEEEEEAQQPPFEHQHEHAHKHDTENENDGEREHGNGGEERREHERDRHGLRNISSGNLRNVEAEHIAAGWPTWLSSAAGEAIHGWLPLRAEAYEKLDKIGQGTYSSVFRAREVETGRIVALKKVQFDNFQRESVRFMAREIMILRKLDHPNILRLEGLITSRLSCSIYLVFEYMEHDLSGLLSSPDVNFTEPQIKCYMKQLLSGVEHCHMRGVMHRDIKTSNILVNNQGVLKLGDFGLANILNSRNRHSLTSRVVTLWYRPPELLMGSTDYGVSVDLWSVGCVFAELLTRKPFLKARTEVEQLHKIFKLCGSPADEYWKQCRLTLASMFKPQHTYESCLRERCKDFPVTATNLIETLLSIEPYKRGTASSAIISKYFMTTPFACESWTLPKYPPNKEIDAKLRDEARRKKSGKTRECTSSRKQRKGRKACEDTNGVPKQRHVHENRRRNKKGESRKGDGSGEDTEKRPLGIPTSSSFPWPSRQKEEVAASLPYSMSFNGLITSVDSNGAPDSNNDGMSYDVKQKYPQERVEFSLSSQPEKKPGLPRKKYRHIYHAGHNNPSF